MCFLKYPYGTVKKAVGYMSLELQVWVKDVHLGIIDVHDTQSHWDVPIWNEAWGTQGLNLWQRRQSWQKKLRRSPQGVEGKQERVDLRQETTPFKGDLTIRIGQRKA